MQHKDSNIVKNKEELEKIPSDKLFISERGYAYNIDEIVAHLKEMLVWRNTILFQDFKYKSGFQTEKLLALFSEKDIKALLQRPEIDDLVMKNATFFHLVDLIKKGNITKATIKLIGKVAKASKIIERNATEILSVELTEALLQLSRHLNNNPEETNKLDRLTSVKGMLSKYSLGRTAEFSDDINNIMRRQCCGGFNIEIAYFYVALCSAYRYAKVLPKLAESKRADSETSLAVNKDEKNTKEKVISKPGESSVSPAAVIASYSPAFKQDPKKIELIKEFRNWLNNNYPDFKEKISNIEIDGDKAIIHTKMSKEEKYLVRDSLFKNQLKLDVENAEKVYYFRVKIHDIEIFLNARNNEQKRPPQPPSKAYF